MKKYNRFLEIKKSPYKTKLITGFDVETFGQKNNYLMNTFFYDNKAFTFWNKEDFLNFLKTNREIQQKCMIFATNLMFDFFAVFNDSEMQKNFELLFRNGRLLKAKTYIVNNEFMHTSKVDKTKSYNSKYKLEFYDTLNFFPASVEKLGECINIPKMKKPKFLGEKPKNIKEKNYLEKYCIRDSEVSCKFMEFLQYTYNNLNGNLKITIPSTSMDLFCRNFLKESLKTPDINIMIEMYKAYYGGRTEAFKRGLIYNVNNFDINSLYPYSMVKQNFPHPNYMLRERLKKSQIYDYEGITEAIIKVPYMYIPYLPFRGHRLLFGIGKYKGYYSFYELRQAEKLGIKFSLLGKQIFSKKNFNPFKEYVTTLWKLRKKWKSENNPAEIVAKLSLNTLYGKFGEKIIDRTDIQFLENFNKEMFLKYFKKGYKMEIVGDIVIIKKPIDDKFNNYVNPLIALYVTAFARNELYKYLIKDEEKTLYCDTDSLFTTSKLKTSDKLGGMKLEKKFNKLVIVKPKFYSGITNKQEIVKIKGVQNVNTINDFNTLLNKKEIKNIRYMKFFESKRRRFLNGLEYNFSINEKLEVIKKLSLNDTKREWVGDFRKDIMQDSIPMSILQ